MVVSIQILHFCQSTECVCVCVWGIWLHMFLRTLVQGLGERQRTTCRCPFLLLQYVFQESKSCPHAWDKTPLPAEQSPWFIILPFALFSSVLGFELRDLQRNGNGLKIIGGLLAILPLFCTSLFKFFYPWCDESIHIQWLHPYLLNYLYYHSKYAKLRAKNRVWDIR